MAISAANPYAAGTYYGTTVVANGASSIIRTNGTVFASGNIGSSTPAGLTLGASGAGSRPSNTEIVEVIILPGVASQATIDAIEQYLRNRYSLY